MKAIRARAALAPLATALCCAVLATGAAAQRGGDDSPDPLAPPPSLEQHSGQNELVQLFAEVELKLREIDLLLSDAGAGEIPLEVPEDSGIADLLRATQAKSSEVISGIDRILELAQSQGGGGSCSDPSCSQCQGNSPGQQPEGQSPLDEPKSGAPGDREETPEMGEQKPEGEKPESESEGSEPKSPKGSDDEGQNNPASPQQSPPPGGASSADDADRWGDLPERAREVFRTKGGDDLPAQYRDWIDSYYRALNRAARDV